MRFIERVTGRAGTGWRSLLVLAPVAYLAGALLLNRFDQTRSTRIDVDRPQAIALAHDFARELGIDTRGWRAFVAYQPDAAWRRYLASHKDAAATLRILAPDIIGRALLVSPDQKDSLEVKFTPEGRVVGYQRRAPADRRLQAIGEAEALALVRSALVAQVGATAAAEHRLVGSETAKDEPAQRTFTWRRTIRGHQQISLDTAIVIRGREVYGRTTKAVVAPSFTSRFNHLQPVQMATRGVIIFLITLALFGYVVARLVARAREDEVPWRRVIFLGLTVAIGIGIGMALSDARVFPQQIGGEGAPGIANTSTSQLILQLVFGAGMIGVTLGLAWGAAEGDVREIFPEKLASFDALLAGAFRSANVWRSVAAGLAFGGYVMLVYGIEKWLSSINPAAYEVMSAEQFAVIMSRAPGLMALLHSLTGVALLLTGILVPVSLLRRRLHGTRLILVVGALLVTYFAIIQTATSEPAWRGALVSIIAGAAIIVPFWRGDLLTAVAAMLGSTAFALAVNLFQGPPSLRASAVRIAVALLVFAVIATIGALRGREITVDARPEYARHISERLALQSEFDAARQAQLRVVPRTLPKMAGLDIAAECRPARRLSGDYYDFIQRDEHRLQIAVAAGEHLPLSSSLAVTVVKGMLFAYSKRGLNPAETLQLVEKHVTAIFGTPLPFSLLLASVDTRAAIVEYATLGTSVGVLMLGRDDAPRWIRPISDADLPITSGSVKIDAGDRLLLTTKGILNAVNESRERFGESRLLASAAASTGDAAELLRASFSGAAAHSEGTDAADDWTAVALRVTNVERNASLQEETA